MSIAIQPGSTDLHLPLPAAGEQVDPYTVHTHYFGLSIPEAELGAFIYARYQPGLRLCQGGIVVFRGLHNDHVLDAEFHDYRATMAWPKVDGSTILLPNALSFQVVDPGELIRVRYTSPDGSVSLEVEQRAVTPLLARGYIMPGEDDHHDRDGDEKPGGIEQFMHCTGELVLRGERHDVDCRAVRDRSWSQIRGEDPGGARRHPPLGWTPMSFGDDLSLNATSIEHPDTSPAWASVYDMGENPRIHHESWIVRDGVPRRLVSVRRDVLEYHPTMYAATRQVLDVVDEDGEEMRFEGEAIAMSAVHAWPNIAFHDSVYRWTDAQGRTTHCTYQEVWYDEYQRAMTARRLAPS
jgi:hypothetical protein